ncbi:MAG: methylenetetrahydrofolate reductase C-terminal domain-containing protein [Lentisphaerae bacterium]|nr:methylenetetrahydrofolate reductase C-terminal domain-containing protein [Lentisphaerota bacterium]
MLREALARGEFVYSTEMVPGRGSGGPAVDAVAAFARRIKESGLPIRSISVTDNPGGNPAIAPDAIAREVLAAGVDPIVNFACRDYNRNALESRMTALARAGVENVLAVTGDYPEGGYGGVARPVFDLDSVQSITYLKAMNRGIEVAGGHGAKGAHQLPSTNFFVGAVVNPFKLREDELVPQLLKLERKVRAGADYIIPQLGYDMRKFLEVKRYMDARGLNVPILGNVYVLNLGTAKIMNRRAVPGCVVSDALLKVVEEESKAPDKGKAKRMERAAKMVAVFRGMGFNGVHLGGFGLKFEDFGAIIAMSEALAPQWETFVSELSFSRPGEFFLFPQPKVWGPARERDPDPIPSLRGGGEGVKSAVMRGFHRALFVENTAGYNLMRSFYQSTASKGALGKVAHALELGSKKVLFGCQDCGDCGLADMAFCCPMSQCPKNLRNGPCGGTRDGQCEVHPEKPCVWTIVYRRNKANDKLDVMRSEYVPPRDARLEQTSGWANFYLGKDYRGRERAHTLAAKSEHIKAPE